MDLYKKKNQYQYRKEILAKGLTLRFLSELTHSTIDNNTFRHVYANVEICSSRL